MGTNQIIYIRVDGNKEIATGHIMRCLTIARACRKQNAQVVFLVSDRESEELLTARMEQDEYSIINLRTNYQDTDEELPVLCQFLLSYPGNVLLIDSYFVTPGYLETLSQIIRVVYLDDLYAFPYPVDTVINYDIDPSNEDPAYSLANRKLLGLSYTPLREMFRARDYSLREEISHILLTAGGMHDGSFFVHLIETLASFYETDAAKPVIHLLLGSGEASDSLKDYLSNHKEVILHDYVDDMAEFLCGFDLVLSACGTTLYEICSLGIPCISFVIADNQIPSAVAFMKHGLVPCIGDLRNENDHGKDLTELLSLLSEYDMRLAQSANMKTAIDKKGADRIADALLTH